MSTVASRHQGPPVLSGGFDAFREVIESTVYPHFVIAEALVPVLKADGSFTTVNGPHPVGEPALLGTVPCQSCGAVSGVGSGVVRARVTAS